MNNNKSKTSKLILGILSLSLLSPPSFSQEKNSDNVIKIARNDKGQIQKDNAETIVNLFGGIFIVVGGFIFLANNDNTPAALIMLGGSALVGVGGSLDYSKDEKTVDLLSIPTDVAIQAIFVADKKLHIDDAELINEYTEALNKKLNSMFFDPERFLSPDDIVKLISKAVKNQQDKAAELIENGPKNQENVLTK